jgi:Fe-S-cluster containining protein
MTDKTLQPLAALYDAMDKTWNKIAAGYHFNCNGCEDNCCKSLFFHHTYIEKAYLLHGFNQLDNNRKEKIMGKAVNYCKRTFSQSVQIKSLKIYCPVNENDRCLLYRYRPMICRLHGLPHELSRPGFAPVKGKGCDAGLFDDKTTIKFDRTPFYQQMAQIEVAFRLDLNKIGKIKETIAQMLVSQ